MIRFFKKSNVASLQRQYDRLMHEAYILSKADPEQSMEKQKQALAVQREIVARG